MKRNLIYLLPLFILCMASCLSKPDKVAPTPALSGTFSGQFQRVHTSVSKGENDTLIANISLTLTNGVFSVAGDTSTVHAGSKGTYTLGVGDDYIFTDTTLPATGTPAKTHLSGDYKFQYNGTILGLDKNVGDTISYQYYLTKN
jgi:hypothetical protein